MLSEAGHKDELTLLAAGEQLNKLLSEDSHKDEYK